MNCHLLPPTAFLHDALRGGSRSAKSVRLEKFPVTATSRTHARDWLHVVLEHNQALKDHDGITVTMAKLTSTLSHRQFPQGAPSTTSQRTLRARHETQARAARRLVTFCGASELLSPPGAALFLDLSVGSATDGDGDNEPLADESLDVSSAIVAISERLGLKLVQAVSRS